jgi:hypothetical protein
MACLFHAGAGQVGQGEAHGQVPVMDVRRPTGRAPPGLDKASGTSMLWPSAAAPLSNERSVRHQPAVQVGQPPGGVAPTGLRVVSHQVMLLYIISSGKLTKNGLLRTCCP